MQRARGAASAAAVAVVKVLVGGGALVRAAVLAQRVLRPHGVCGAGRGRARGSGARSRVGALMPGSQHGTAGLAGAGKR